MCVYSSALRRTSQERKKQKKKRRHKSVCNDICPPSLGLLEASFTSLLCVCGGGAGGGRRTPAVMDVTNALCSTIFFSVGGRFPAQVTATRPPHRRFFFVVFFYDALGRDPNHVNASQIIKGKGRVLFCYKVLGEMSSISLTPISFLA